MMNIKIENVSAQRKDEISRIPGFPEPGLEKDGEIYKIPEFPEEIENGNHDTDLSKIPKFPDGDIQDVMEKDVSEISRPLTDEEKAYYKEKLDCSDRLLDTATIDENGKLHVKTINEGKAGEVNENGVKYERKTIVVNGVEVEGVFPVFDSKFDLQLPEDMLKASDSKQETYCNEKLKDAVENDFELAKQFTPEQLEQIKNGDTPDGYTWHHNEEAGKMQLVKTDDHQANRHTGGKAIWDGGQGNR